MKYKNADRFYYKSDLKGGLYDKFGIPIQILHNIRYRVNAMYNNVNIKKITPILLHKLFINIFYTDYYPIISNNINIDNYTNVILMGGIAYNINIPKELQTLKTDTEDIDLKIYTTQLNYLNIDNPQNSRNISNIISTLTFTLNIICLYLIQIVKLFNYITNPGASIKQTTHKQENLQGGATRKHRRKHKNKKKTKKQTQQKPKPENKPENKHNITIQHNKDKQTKKNIMLAPASPPINSIYNKKGILNNYKIAIQIKEKTINNEHKIIEVIDITTLPYNTIYNTILNKINNPQYLITTKISYNIHYSNADDDKADADKADADKADDDKADADKADADKASDDAIIKADNTVEPVLNINNKILKMRTITFNDLHIVYADKTVPSFYSYYLMHNANNANANIGKGNIQQIKHNQDNNLNQIIHKHIQVSEIWETLSYKNNITNTTYKKYKYLSINSLLIDITIMLIYAEFLNDNIYINKKHIIISVPISWIYKYYKYLSKFIRLHYVKKYNEKTATDVYFNAIKKLDAYIMSTLKQYTNMNDETSELNIKYKKLLNTFHQDFFINKTLLKQEFSELEDIVDSYNTISKYVHKSRALFKHLIDNTDKHTAKHTAKLSYNKNHKNHKNDKHNTLPISIEDTSILISADIDK